MIGALAGLRPASLARPAGGATLGGIGTVAPAAGNPDSFAAALARVAGNTVEALKGAESVSVDALQGKADTRQVVDAVMSAEQAMQTAVALRDKIVSAYLEVSRMSI